MKKKKILTIGTFILVIALVGVLPVSAEAVKTDYSANATVCEILDMGTSWTDGGIEHYRNVKYTQFVYSADEPRVIGFQYSVISWNYNTKTGSGVMWGTFTHDVESGGTWRGTVTGKNEYGIITEGKGIGKGYGDLDGLLVKATFYEDDNIDLSGVPEGEECPLAPFYPTQVHTQAVIIDTTNH